MPGPGVPADPIWQHRGEGAGAFPSRDEAFHATVLSTHCSNSHLARLLPGCLDGCGFAVSSPHPP